MHSSKASLPYRLPQSCRTPGLSVPSWGSGLYKPQELVYLPASALQQSLGVLKPRSCWEDCRLGTTAKAGSLEELGLPSSVSFSCLHHGCLKYFKTLGKIISLGNFINLVQTQLFFLHSQFQNFLSLIMSMTDELGNICLFYEHTEYFGVSVDKRLFAMDLDQEHWLKELGKQ